MITITPKAVTHILTVLEKEGARDAYLRVHITQGCSHCGNVGYGLSISEKPGEEDVVAQSNGIKIVVDRQNAEHLRGAELDYIETLERSGFTIRNPNANPGCGCGH